MGPSQRLLYSLIIGFSVSAADPTEVRQTTFEVEKELTPLPVDWKATKSHKKKEFLKTICRELLGM